MADCSKDQDCQVFDFVCSFYLHSQEINHELSDRKRNQLLAYYNTCRAFKAPIRLQNLVLSAYPIPYTSLDGKIIKTCSVPQPGDLITTNNLVMGHYKIKGNLSRDVGETSMFTSYTG